MRAVRRDGAVALGLGLLAVAIAVVPASPASAALGELIRVDLGANGLQANAGVVDGPSLSADGRYVAFASEATNLVAGDTNGYSDVFVRDRVAGTTTRVSVSGGTQGNGASLTPTISANGRYVAFTSYASNLSTKDKNSSSGGSDVFVRDLVAGTTVRISAAGNGGSANGESDFASISADGRYVAYDSTATNLTTGDTNGFGDVFVWDRTTGKNVRISTTAAGKPATGGGSGLASISADGSKVAFLSNATNLVTGDRNQIADAFVKDVKTGAVVRIAVRRDGTETFGAADHVTISADGSKVAFDTYDQLTVADDDWSSDVYVHDLVARTTTMVSRNTAANDLGRGDSYGASLTADGRQVVFTSAATDLGPASPGGSQVYLKNLATGSVRLLSVGLGGAAPDDTGHAGFVTADGSHVAFASNAQNLVAYDNNHAEDVFVLDFSGTVYPTFSVPSPDRYAAETSILDGPWGESVSVASFEFGANETGVTYQYSLDGGAWKATGSTLTLTPAEGSHVLEVRAIDAAGNVDSSPAQIAFTIGAPTSV